MTMPSRRSERRIVSPACSVGATETAVVLVILVSAAPTGLLVLAAARHHLLLSPLVEDLLGASGRLHHRILRRQRAGGRLGEHVREDVGVEDLALGRVAEARMTEVRGPRHRLREQRQLVGRSRDPKGTRLVSTASSTAPLTAPLF